MQTETDTSVPGEDHGTCVWAKAVGPRDGVAKLANYVAVKIREEYYETEDPDGIIDVSFGWLGGDIINGLLMTAQDIAREHPDGRSRAIVTISTVGTFVPEVVCVSSTDTNFSVRLDGHFGSRRVRYRAGNEVVLRR